MKKSFIDEKEDIENFLTKIGCEFSISPTMYGGSNCTKTLNENKKEILKVQYSSLSGPLADLNFLKGICRENLEFITKIYVDKFKQFIEIINK
jgi:hypothetical protein